MIHKQQGVTAEEMIESMSQGSPLILGHASSGGCVRGKSSVGDFHSMASSDEYSAVDTAGCVDNRIITASCGYFDYADPKPESICIEDIALALSNTARFSGHCQFYSVAEHSVQCLRIAEEIHGEDLELQFAVLMHDAAESYISDLPKPLKIMCPTYREIEARVERVIEEKFQISAEHKEQIKEIDLMMLKVEKKALFPGTEDWSELGDIPDIGIELFLDIPKAAEEDFYTEAMTHLIRKGLA